MDTIKFWFESDQKSMVNCELYEGCSKQYNRKADVCEETKTTMWKI